MAGMFYSLSEVANKLGMTEDQVSELVHQGKLREFRDGTNLWFKADEVNSLAQNNDTPKSDRTSEPKIEIAPELQIAQESALEEDFDLDLSDEQTQNIEEMPSANDEFDLMLSDEDLPIEEAVTAQEPEEELKLADDELSEEEFKLADDEPAINAQEDDLALIDLEDETTVAKAQDISTGDTDAADDNINIFEDFLLEEEKPQEAAGKTNSLDDLLGETTAEDKISFADDVPKSKGPTGGESFIDGLLDDGPVEKKAGKSAGGSFVDDLLGETQVGSGSHNAGDGLSLEEIEEDVNLDTFGSGSGLLDLSLQADDTSLGGILDEIYTPEDGGAGEAPVGSDLGLGAGSDMMAEGESVGYHGMMVPGAYIEPEPDRSTNIFGAMLFLPLLVLFYTALVAVAGQMGTLAGIYSAIKDYLGYVLAGLIVAALIWAVVGATATEPGAVKPAKEKKEKVTKVKEKKEKPIKEKKVKEKKKK